MPHPGGAVSTCIVEIVGHVVSRSQSSVADVGTACERRKRESCREASVQCSELVMLTVIEKPKDNGVTQNCVGIVSHLVGRSDEVVVKARIVCRVLEKQRGDARDPKSTRGVPWQQCSAETAGGETVNAACVTNVLSIETVVEPRENKARWFYVKREVKLAKCGFPDDCEGCRVAASCDEVLRPHGEEC